MMSKDKDGSKCRRNMGGWVNEHNMHVMGCHIVQSFLAANDYITGMNDA